MNEPDSEPVKQGRHPYWTVECVHPAYGTPRDGGLAAESPARLTATPPRT
ncbi:hypothetical protein ACH437_04265 [Streptomyces xinghaiensis]